MWKNAWFGKCEKCSSKTVSHEDFSVDLIDDSDSENSDNDSDNDQTAVVAFYESAREGTKLKKMLFKESIDSAVRKFKHHIYVRCIQFNYYNSIKNNLGRNDILVHADYSEGYENKPKHEIQSAYFGHTSFSIFTACCYL